MRDSTQLLRDYAERGSEQAFREIVDRYVDLVFSVALRQAGGDHHRAEDIVQMVFAALARKAGAPGGPLREEPCHLGGWLHRHTCYVASDLRRTEQRRHVREETAIAMSTLQPEPAPEWHEVSPWLDASIQDLTEADRRAIVLRFYERLDLRTVGRHLGVSDDAAQKRISRALERLRDLLATRGVALSVAALGTLLSERAVTAAPAGLGAAVGAGVLSSAGLAGAVAGGVGGSKLVAMACGLALVGGVVVFLLLGRPGGAGAGDHRPVPAAAIGASHAPAAEATLAGGVVGAADRAEQAGPGDAVVSGAGRLVLRLVEAASGRPVPRVPIEYRGWEGEHFTRKALVADGAGLCEVPVEQGTTHLELTTRLGGIADTRLEWRTDRGQVIPSEYTLRLATAVRIGGRVVDADGIPVFGAKVGFNHEDDPAASASVESHQFGWVEAETDVTGRWRLERMAESVLPAIYGSARHPDHAGTPLVYAGRDPVTLRQLREESYEFRLGRADSVRGLVVDLEGRGVGGARVRVGLFGESGSREGVADAEGRFDVAGCRPGEALVTAEAPGFAPTTIRVTVPNPAEPARLVLGPGGTLRLRVTDREGRPVEGANVWFDTMSHAFSGPEGAGNIPVQVEFAPKTDGEGRVVWEHAPERDLGFDVHKAGFMRLSGFRVRPDGEEHAVLLSPALVVSGTVRDASTGEPVPKFRMGVGWPEDQSGDGNSRPRWSTLERFWPVFEGGRFRHSIEEAAIGGIPNPGYHFRFEAEGYAPKVTRRVGPEESEVSLEIQLEPARVREISIVQPDGQPAAHADMGFLEPGARLRILPGRLDRDPTLTVLRTDADGRVRLRDEPEARRVVVVHETGYLDVDVVSVVSGAVLTLQPWGRVEGTVWRRGKPAEGRQIRVILAARDAAGHAGMALDGPAFEASTGVDGGFVLPRVPPVPLVLVERVEQPSQGTVRSWTQRHLGAVEAQPGRTARVDLGRTDRPVTVRLRLPDGAEGAVRFAMIGSPMPMPPAGVVGNPAELHRWHRRPEVASMLGAQRSFPLSRQEDGTWRAEEVTPGSYVVRARLDLPGQAPQPGLMAGLLEAPVSVPEGAPDSMADLGEIALQPRH